MIRNAIGKVAKHKTTRASGRIGIGTFVAIVIAYYVQIPEPIHEAVTGIIILVVNELAYAGDLKWRAWLER